MISVAQNHAPLITIFLIPSRGAHKWLLPLDRHSTWVAGYNWFRTGIKALVKLEADTISWLQHLQLGQFAGFNTSSCFRKFPFHMCFTCVSHYLQHGMTRVVHAFGDRLFFLTKPCRWLYKSCSSHWIEKSSPNSLAHNGSLKFDLVALRSIWWKLIFQETFYQKRCSATMMYIRGHWARKRVFVVCRFKLNFGLWRSCE